MIKPFDPSNLDPRASLNRVRIGNGDAVPAEVRGKTGLELVSVGGWSAMLRQHADALRLSADQLQQSDRELPILLGLCFRSADAAVREAAGEVVRRLALNMGYILWTLKRPDPATRAARSDWDDTYWTVWQQQIETVILGGGLLSDDTIGACFIDQLSRFCREHGLYTPMICEPPCCRRLMPLIGVARTVPCNGECAATVVFDFGCSYVKRGVARYADHSLVDLEQLPTLPASADGSAQEVFDFVVETIVATHKAFALTAHSAPPTAVIPVSVAAYVNDGQPYDYQSRGYAATRQLSDNAAAALSRAVSQRLGMPARIILLHDGTAAAHMYAGSTKTAVIVLGTAMGIGFPPPAQGLQRLPVDLRIHALPTTSPSQSPARAFNSSAE
jgi:hypothetical protein